MKNLNLLEITELKKNELVTVDGGSVNPDRLNEYIEERYGEGTNTGYNLSR